MKDASVLKSLYILIITAFVIFLSAFFSSNLEKAVLFDEDVVMFNEGWRYNQSGNDSSLLTLPASVEISNDPTVAITNTLPEDYVPGMSLSIATTLQTLDIYIDQVKVYEYGNGKETIFATGGGSAYHIIRLPEDSKGKEITIQLSSPYSTFRARIPSVALGSKTANIYHIIKIHLFPFVISVISLLAGLVYIFFHLLINKMLKSSKSLLYLGLFAVLASAWSATETQMLQFIIPYEYTVNLIRYLTLMLCPIPALLFVKGITHSSKNKLIKAVLILQIFNFIITNLFALLHIATYHTMLPLTHFAMLSTVILSIYLIWKEMFYYKNRESYIYGISIAILGFFSTAEIVRFNLISVEDASGFFRIGMLFFIILTGFSAAAKVIDTLKMGINAETIQDLAYADVLTGLSNRNAYMKDMEELNRKLTQNSNIVVGMFDLNNLKEVNDNLGHKAGDVLLMKAGLCIANSVSSYGQCYRIGGDEFAVIIINKDSDIIPKCKQELWNQMNAYNQNNNVPLVIPCGYAAFDPVQDRDLYATFNRADQLMYSDKERTKEINAVATFE
ncbi:MAG: hypothetical protein K0R21_2077 [Anaerocolumna sp.]|jgi:diguanylate cyclase (GGDEF)-like protein|nr:hypothetical protein [Anaerocolumna sp.]